MKQRIQNMNLKNKRVILRLDLNVPINNGQILDDTKIVASLETIKYLLSQNCSIVILSHLGKIKEEADKKKYTLEPVALHLKTLLNYCNVAQLKFLLGPLMHFDIRLSN